MASARPEHRLLTELALSRHCVQRYRDRVAGAARDLDAAHEQLRTLIIQRGRLSDAPPAWFAQTAGRGARFVVIEIDRDEMVVPIVPAQSHWLATTLVNRRYAKQALASDEMADLLTDLRLPDSLLRRVGHTGETPGQASARLVRTLYLDGTVGEEPPAWADGLTGGDLYLGVARESVALAVRWVPDGVAVTSWWVDGHRSVDL